MVLVVHRHAMERNREVIGATNQEIIVTGVVEDGAQATTHLQALLQEVLRSQQPPDTGTAVEVLVDAVSSQAGTGQKPCATGETISTMISKLHVLILTFNLD